MTTHHPADASTEVSLDHYCVLSLTALCGIAVLLDANADTIGSQVVAPVLDTGKQHETDHD